MFEIHIIQRFMCDNIDRSITKNGLRGVITLYGNIAEINQVCGSAFVANATSLHVMNVTVSQVS